jgi:large subunit ribosomal protein L22
MEARSTARYLPMSQSKMQRVLNLVRGEKLERALDVLRLNRSRPARMVEKVIHAATASAMEQHDVDAEDLLISRAWVETGPSRRWRMPRARGSWTPIIHRTCHLHIVVSDETPAPAADKEAERQ